MIELRLLGSPSRMFAFPLAALPVSVGRDCTTSVPLSGPGVWDRHFRIEFDVAQGFVVESMGEAFTAIDGQRITRCRLRNGDVIECGGNRLEFWLAPAPQRRLRAYEALVWAIATALAVAQMVVANWIGR